MSKYAIILILILLAFPGIAYPEPPPEHGMTFGQAVVLGLVEGITEYTPVSSTGHLILTQRAMGIGQTEEEKEAADAYSIVIQAGAILAVLTLYFPYVRRMLFGLFGRDAFGLRLLINIVVAFLPAAVIGLIFHGPIKQYLFGLQPIVFAWFVGGLAILAVSWWRKGKPPTEGLNIEDMTWKMALVIGFMQCIAMWPGTSRSLVTILGGVLVGMNLPAAVIFSFLLGVVTLTAATAHDALHHGALMLEAYGWTNIATGFVMATLSAVLAVKWLVTYLKRHGLWIFGWYRVALAVVVTILMWRGILTDTL